MRRAGTVFMVLAVVLTLWSGCGNNAGSVSQPTPSAAPGNAAQSASTTPRLATPIYPHCGTGRFATPMASPTPTHAGSPPAGWQVLYRYPTKGVPSPQPRDTTFLSIIERVPSTAVNRVIGGHDITVAGHHVSLRDRTATTFYVAEWETSKAHYVALANGATAAPLKQVIACLP